MAKALMEAFPLMPDVDFDTTKKAMKSERRTLALQILDASGIPYVHVFHFDLQYINIHTYIF